MAAFNPKTLQIPIKLFFLIQLIQYLKASPPLQCHKELKRSGLIHRKFVFFFAGVVLKLQEKVVSYPDESQGKKSKVQSEKTVSLKKLLNFFRCSISFQTCVLHVTAKREGEKKIMKKTTTDKLKFEM